MGPGGPPDGSPDRPDIEDFLQGEQLHEEDSSPRSGPLGDQQVADMLMIISGHSNRGTGDTDPPLEMGSAAPWRRGHDAGFPAPESLDLPTPSFWQGCAVLAFLAVVVIAGIVVWHAQSTPGTQVNISPAPTDIPGPSPTETPTPLPTPTPPAPRTNVSVRTADYWAMAYEKDKWYANSSGTPELSFGFTFVGLMIHTPPTRIADYYFQVTCVKMSSSVTGTVGSDPVNEQQTPNLWYETFYWDGSSSQWVLIGVYSDPLAAQFGGVCRQSDLGSHLPSANDVQWYVGPDATPIATPKTSP